MDKLQFLVLISFITTSNLLPYLIICLSNLHGTQYFVPGRMAKYCHDPPVCLSVREHISGTTGPFFTKLFGHVTRCRGLGLLCRCCDMLWHSLTGMWSWRLTRALSLALAVKLIALFKSLEFKAQPRLVFSTCYLVTNMKKLLRFNNAFVYLNKTAWIGRNTKTHNSKRTYKQCTLKTTYSVHTLWAIQTPTDIFSSKDSLC